MAETGPILHLSTASTWRGGEQQALYLVAGLQARGIDNLVVTQPEAPLAERVRTTGARVIELRCRGEWDLLARWKLARLMKREAAVLLHAHDAHGATVGGAAARRAGRPAVCTRRVDFEVRSVKKYARLDRVICISEAIRTVCRDAGVPEDRLRLVPSGIDLARIREGPEETAAVRQEFAPDKKKPLLLLNVASLTDHKGQRYLLEAMPAVLARLPQTQLVIVGTGELEGPLRHQANLLAIDEDVTFAGFREDVPTLLKACDLFVMASHLEGLCTSVMDAMAAGKAVVATAAGGLPELVEDGRTGLVVPVRDPDALAAGLLDLLTDRKKRERFAKAAGEVAAKRFDKERMIDGTLAVYRELAAVPATGAGESRGT